MNAAEAQQQDRCIAEATGPKKLGRLHVGGDGHCGVGNRGAGSDGSRSKGARRKLGNAGATELHRSTETSHRGKRNGRSASLALGNGQAGAVGRQTVSARSSDIDRRGCRARR